MQELQLRELQEKEVESGVRALAAAMVLAGGRGCVGVGLGWLLLHTNVLEAFRCVAC
jgi:hypothetical protein